MSSSAAYNACSLAFMPACIATVFLPCANSAASCIDKESSAKAESACSFRGELKTAYHVIVVKESRILHVLSFLLAAVLTDIEVARGVTQPVCSECYPRCSQGQPHVNTLQEVLPVQVTHQLVTEESFASAWQANQDDDQLLSVHTMNPLALLRLQSFRRYFR